MTPEQRERAEYAEIEVDAARAAQFMKHGGFWWRIMGWVERQARLAREDVERDMGLRK